MNRNSSGAFVAFGLLLCIPFVLATGYRIYRAVDFGIECSGHLKRAADSNSIQLASSELTQAIAYLDANGMTHGYTSVFYRSPDEDVGFWHDNLKSSLDTLNALSPKASELERTNVLMKLRETLLDHGQHGDTVTSPDGISIFPGNGGFAAIFGFATLLGIIGALMLLVALG